MYVNPAQATVIGNTTDIQTCRAAIHRAVCSIDLSGVKAYVKAGYHRDYTIACHIRQLV